MDMIALLGYRGARKLLETLLKFPKRLFTINELAKEANVPFASAWRLVKRWEPAGIIQTGRVGKSVTVSLKKSGYVDSAASILKESESPQAFAVGILKRKLAGEMKIREAYLFGSVAQGSEKPSSDIDVALLVSGGYDPNKLVFGIYEKCGAKLVPICFKSRKEVDSFMAGKKGVRLK